MAIDAPFTPHADSHAIAPAVCHAPLITCASMSRHDLRQRHAMPPPPDIIRYAPPPRHFDDAPCRPDATPPLPRPPDFAIAIAPPFCFAPQQRCRHISPRPRRRRHCRPRSRHRRHYFAHAFRYMPLTLPPLLIRHFRPPPLFSSALLLRFRCHFHYCHFRFSLMPCHYLLFLILICLILLFCMLLSIYAAMPLPPLFSAMLDFAAAPCFRFHYAPHYC